MARPAATGRKRAAEPDANETPENSPEPATQRRRTSQEDEDVLLNEADNDNDDTYGDDGGANGDVSFDQMVKKFVRLAMACEYQRRPIRRAEISEKVMVGAQGSRKYKDLFMRTQTELRSVFGMELVELPARERTTLAQKRAAAAKSARVKGDAKTAPLPTASWILTSVLPSKFRDPEILAPPAAPTAGEDAIYTGLYTTLVSLISLSGNALPDAKLERYMRRLHISDNAPLDNGRERTDKTIKRMEKEGYIVRVRENIGMGEGDIYWTLGPRAKVEVGDDGVRGLVKAVYAPAEEAAEAELERKIARNLGLGEGSKKPPDRATQQPPGETQRKRRGRPRRVDDEEDGESDEASEYDA